MFASSANPVFGNAKLTMMMTVRKKIPRHAKPEVDKPIDKVESR